MMSEYGLYVMATLNFRTMRYYTTNLGVLEMMAIEAENLPLVKRQLKTRLDRNKFLANMMLDLAESTNFANLVDFNHEVIDALRILRTKNWICVRRLRWITELLKS